MQVHVQDLIMKKETIMNAGNKVQDYDIVITIIIMSVNPIVLLERVSGFLDKVCPGDLIEYRCSSGFYENTTLIWDINILGEQPQRIIYSESSTIGVINENMYIGSSGGMDIRTILTDYTVGRSINSTLMLTVNSKFELYDISVACTVDPLAAVTDAFQTVFLREGIKLLYSCMVAITKHYYTCTSTPC